MTDIEQRIDAHLENDNAEQRWLNADNLLEEAQAEIKRLRGIIQQAADDVVAASYPRRMRLEWLEAARSALADDDGPYYNL